jgi:glutathione synthase/RimK-type ligase-like ATP-grasp enzyme
MPRCAFLTIADREGWFIDDDLVHGPLRQLGWTIDDVPWTDDVDWNRFDLVVIRSPWDYQQDPERFFAVLESIERSSAVLFNSLNTVRWNINKSYLFVLQQRGIEIVPTLRFVSVTVRDLRQAAAWFHSDQWVMKPIVGANADDTFRVRHGTSDQELAKLCAYFENSECLVQPFMNQIPVEGEFSLIYFDGKFSHAIIKRVREGDFRVQEEHGGKVAPLNHPEPGLIAAAERTMSVLDEVPLYARIDLVRTPENRFALMELELIEPSLYFRFSAGAAAEFAKVIERRFKLQSQADSIRSGGRSGG